MEVTAEDAAAVRAAEAVAVGVIAVVAVVAMVDIVVDTAVMAADTVGAVDAGKNQSPQRHGDRDKNLERAARNRGLC